MNDQPMPDFVEGLERELRAAARRRPASGQAPGDRRRLLAAVAAAMVAASAAAVVVLPSSDRGGSVARAAPIFQRPRVDAAQLRRDLPDVAPSVRRYDLVRMVEVPGGRAYLVPKGQGWCLYGPDPATDRPQEEYGGTCTTGHAFSVQGITMLLGTGPLGYALVAVPDAEVDTPTITSADGETRILPVRNGVALAVGIEEGDTITAYGTDGVAHDLDAPTGRSGVGPGTRHDCGDGRASNFWGIC
ncbi:hypothetical protein [Patulibacter defluvii]|uniref:hypothetical protein n=1 Tax=Patulibacter defluvii TaxID=3095358 RepID=UPI002A7661DD|nr:hypothetical protein [Patulibacter sp. DM4]